MVIIIDFALLSERTGNVFHSYIRIHYLIPSRVKDLTKITDDKLASIGFSFKDVFGSMNNFIESETLENENTPLIITHAGFLFDFPKLLSNCMKHKIHKKCLYVDSLRIMSENGYHCSGLDSLCEDFGLKRDVTFTENI